MLSMVVKKNADGQTLVQFTRGDKTASMRIRPADDVKVEWVELACFTEGVSGMTRGPECVSVEEALKAVSDL